MCHGCGAVRNAVEVGLAGWIGRIVCLAAVVSLGVAIVPIAFGKFDAAFFLKYAALAAILGGATALLLERVRYEYLWHR